MSQAQTFYKGPLMRGLSGRSNWKFIILAIILIGVVVNVSGIVFCLADNLIAVGVSNAVSILVGLTLVGCMTPENRWRNIILVAAGVWVTDLLPAAIGAISLSFSGWIGVNRLVCHPCGPIWCYLASNNCFHQAGCQPRLNRCV
jgi:hypothetical protein